MRGFHKTANTIRHATRGRRCIWSPCIAARSAPRLLDIGCAHGDFPRFMKNRGWEVEGVEFFGLNQADFRFQGLSRRFRARTDSTQPVRCGHRVGRHRARAQNAPAYFRKVASILRPGGVFVFLVTNFDSLASRRLFAEDVPRHLYFFTEPTVAQCWDVGLTFDSAHHSNAIFEMPATNWLLFLIKRLTGRPFRWEDRRSLVQFRRTHHLAADASSALQFFLSSPLSAVDRAMVPLLERYFIGERRTAS